MKLKELKILGIKISVMPKAEVLPCLADLVVGEGRHLITTPNPEFLLASRKDDEFAYLLNKATLALPDGIGLKFAGWFKGVNLSRYAGADLTKELLATAENHDWPVAIINWHASLSSAADISQTLKKLYPALKFLVKDERRGDYVFDKSDLKHFKPKIIFSSLGAPYQEKLLWRLLKEVPAKLGVGVGGSFDYLTGKAKRAPRYWRLVGLEWLWRLIQAPSKRLRRIYNAVVVFPLAFFREEVFSRIFYRPNVVGFIFQGDEVLLTNADMHDDLDYWKLPQGGVEPDESKDEALMREMAEELGTADFQILGRFDNIYKYKWPVNRRIGYKGQKQTLFILRYGGVKNNIRLSRENKAYKWVKIDDLLTACEPLRRPAYALFIEKYKETVK